MSDDQEAAGDWAELQKRYWQELSRMQQQLTGIPGSEKQAWEAMMDQWWQTLAPTADSTTAHFVEKMMGHGKAFFGLAESLSQSSGFDPDQTSNLYQNFFTQLKEKLNRSPDSGDSLGELMAFWELPFDNWQKMAAMFTPMQVFQDGYGAIPGVDDLEKLFNMPGLGFHREDQERQQALQRRLRDYQETVKEYARFFSDMAVACVDRMEQRVEALRLNGEKVESAKVLYDLWVAVCEETYAERVISTDYARLHGKLVNRLMGLKQQYSLLIDERLAAMDMPTRSEVRTLQQRVQESRREIKQLKAELAQLKTQKSVSDKQKKSAGKRTKPKQKKPA